MKKWESEKHKCWDMPAEGFKGHVATDGSLLGTAAKWRACGWSVVANWIMMKNWDLCMGCMALWRLNLKSSAELTASLWLLTKVIGPIKVHVDNKGIVDGLWRGER